MHEPAEWMRDGARLPRVVALPERYGRVVSPCASIRLQPFLDRLKRQGRIDLRYLIAAELAHCQADVIVWHRTSLSAGAELDSLRDAARRTGARLIYDLDDNLLELGNHPERAEYRALTEAVASSLRLADEVWCSTQALAEEVAANTRARVKVMKNALDPELWSVPPRDEPAADPRAALQVLYMGTRTHDDDFALLEAAMSELHADEPGRYRLTLLGGIRREAISQPWLDVLHPPAHIGASYPAFVHWFSDLNGYDLGVAPLLENAFNHCKSAIKVQDYAAIGLPTLASRVPAYAADLRDGVHCHLVENQPRAWAARIRELARDRARRLSVMPQARALIGESVFTEGTRLRADSLLGL